MKTNFKNLIKNQNGFTFIELIVVISIFAIMSGVVIFKFDDFSSNITLQNLSHDIALRIKKAQNEAIFGQSNTIGQQNFGVSYTGEYADRYAPTYGIHFSPDNNKQFTFFADRQFTYNGTYDIGGSTCNSPGGGTECLEDVNIQGSETITELCVNVTTVGSCVDLGGTIIND